MTTDTTAPAPAAGFITIEDVRRALGDTDPSSTNADRLQKIIGRGSNATVQKYLTAIRAERMPAPVAPAAPSAPGDVLAALWSAALSAAQLHTLTRMESVTAERDRLAESLAQTQQDLSAALEASDTATAAAAAAAAAAETADVKLAAAFSTIEQQQQEQVRINDELERMLTKVKADAALAEREHQIRVSELQAALDRQADKYADLRGMIDRLAPAPPVAPVATKATK